MEKSSKKAIIAKLSSNSARQIYNALVQIRTNFVKSSEGIKILKSEGVIQKLIQLLQNDEHLIKGTCDIVLSILGNLCMKEEVRLIVQKHRGIPVIAQYFCESDLESIQNRGCRTLANLALSASACQDVHETESDTVAKIVTLLTKTENKECQLTYCRAIRLLGRTATQVDKLTEKNAVTAVCKLLGYTDTELKHVALRTLFELSKHGCSSGFANQVTGAGSIKEILDLLTSDDSTVSHQAFAAIFKLIDQPDFRPPFGSAGGITLFINLSNSDLSLDCRISIVNVLCLCSKEVVNRSKIRDNEGLLQFLSHLENDEMHIVHDRIISALLCYLYDDQSINVLLENNMVKVLTAHLERVAKFKSSSQNLESHEESATSQSEDEDSVEESLAEPKEGYADKGNEAKKPGDILFSIPKISVTEPTSIQSSKTKVGSRSYGLKFKRERSKDYLENEMNIIDAGPSGVRSVEDTCTSEGIQVDIGDQDNEDPDSGMEQKTNKHVFSIDSPTYEVNTDWDFYDNEGITCRSKQTFSKPFDDMSSTLSPLSTISYFSPDYSPCHSPSGESHSSLNNDPKYPMVCSTPYYYGSPEKCKSGDALSPLGYSPSGSATPQEFLYSDSEDEDSQSSNSIPNKPELSELKEMMDIHVNERVSGKFVLEKEEISCKEQTVAENKIVEKMDIGLIKMEIYCEGEDDKKNMEHFELVEDTGTKSGKKETAEMTKSDIHTCDNSATESNANQSKLDSNHSNSNTDLTSHTKRQKKRQNTSPNVTSSKRRKVSLNPRTSPTSTEIHISMILSRASQLNDPSKYMVTVDTTCCLLDYLSIVDKPETRMARILSRLVRNPNCFEKFLHMNLPIIIFEKLLNGNLEVESLTNLKAIVNDRLSFTQGGRRPGQRSRSDSVSSTSSDLSLLDLDDDFLTAPAPTTNAGESANRTSPITAKSKQGQRKSLDDSEAIDEGISLKVKVGLSLLHDVYFMANSPFGRGVVAHWYAKKDKMKKLGCAVSLLYVTWYSSMQYFYFFTLKVLDDVLQILLDKEPVKLYTVALHGLIFLGKMLNLNLKLKVDNLVDTFCNHDVKDMEQSMEHDCVYGSLSENHNLIIRVVENGSSSRDGTKILASRLILIKSSPMFAAMLEGHYSESKQSEIKISETSFYAVRFIIHYLHGCTLSCDVISDLLNCELSNENLYHALEVLSLAHRYLVIALYNFIQSVICTRFLDHQNVFLVFEFASLHSFEDLALDSVKSIFMERSNKNAISGMKKCLQGSLAKPFLDAIKTMIRKLCQ